MKEKSKSTLRKSTVLENSNIEIFETKNLEKFLADKKERERIFKL
jgi:hypothetical protein